jgi:hypothetical protein
LSKAARARTGIREGGDEKEAEADQKLGNLEHAALLVGVEGTLPEFTGLGKVYYFL